MSGAGSRLINYAVDFSSPAALFLAGFFANAAVSDWLAAEEFCENKNLVPNQPWPFSNIKQTHMSLLISFLHDRLWRFVDLQVWHSLKWTSFVIAVIRFNSHAAPDDSTNWANYFLCFNTVHDIKRSSYCFSNIINQAIRYRAKNLTLKFCCKTALLIIERGRKSEWVSSESEQNS